MGTMPDLGLVCGVDSHADTIMAAVCDPTRAAAGNRGGNRAANMPSGPSPWSG
jgi:hypothetical protein